MANKQTLVAQAKQFFHDFQHDLPTTERLYKEMFDDVVQLQSKFSDLYKDIPSDLISAAENGSWEVPSNPDPFFAQMKGLVDAAKQFRQELFRIKAEAGRAMAKFSKFNKDDSWATLSRSDILELRKLFKKDERIAKFQKMNVDELEKEWDKPGIVKKLDICCLKLWAIQTKRTAAAAGKNVDSLESKM